jgi:Raf kinase inhibitor-like YbhB/YbcL family protein
VIGDRRLTAHRTIAEPLGDLPVTARHDRTALNVIACSLAMIVTGGCQRKDSLPAEDPARQTITLRSPAFEDGGMIPQTFTCDSSDRSPPLEWSGVPASARSLVLICDDPDAPLGTWSHWVVFNLAPQVRALKEGVPPGETIAAAAADESKAGDDNSPKARQGTNDFGKLGYGGPCPPSGTHRYFFRLYALDIPLDLGSSVKRGQVLKAIEGHILAEGRLMGKYKRAA